MSILIKCDSLPDARRIISAIYIVASSEYVEYYTDEDGNETSTPATRDKNFLKNLIASTTIIYDDTDPTSINSSNHDNTYSVGDTDVNKSEISLDVQTWIANFSANVNTYETAEENYHYNLDFVKDLTHF